MQARSRAPQPRPGVSRAQPDTRGGPFHRCHHGLRGVRDGRGVRGTARTRHRAVLERERRDRDGDQPVRGVGAPEGRRRVEHRVGAVPDDHVGCAGGILVEQGDDGVAVLARGVQGLEDQDDGGVPRFVLASELPLGGPVHRLAGQVGGTDERGVDLPRPDGPGREFQRHRPGRLLRRDREPGARQVELGADPVRHEVRHAAHHPLRGHGRHERVPGEARRRRRGGEPGLLQPVGNPPAGARPGHLGVHSHPDDHHGPLPGQGHRPYGLPGGLQHQELMAHRPLQGQGREAQVPQLHGDLRGGATPLTAQHRPPEVLGTGPVADPGADGDDRHRRTAARRLPHPGRGGHGGGRAGRSRYGGHRVAVRKVHHQMGVGPAEPERAHRRPARPRPRFRRGQHPQRRARQRLQRPLCAERRRTDPRTQRAEHLQQPGHARRGQQVPDVRLHRTDGHVVTGPEDPGHAACLHRVPDRRPRRVALDERHGPGRDARRVVRQAHGPDLALLRRTDQPGAAPVVGQPDTADHAEHGQTGGTGLGQPHQGDEAGALAVHQSVRVPVEGPTAPRAARRGQPAEPHVQIEGVRPADRTGHHQVRRAVVQPVARQLDRVQRRRAGGVEGPRARAQPEGPGREPGGQPGREAVPGVGPLPELSRQQGVTERGPLGGQPDVLGESRPRGRGIGQVPQHQPRARQRALAARLRERLPDAVHDPVEERVQRQDPLRSDPEAARIEDGLEPPYVPADIGPGAVEVVVHRAHGPVARQPPPALRDG